MVPNGVFGVCRFDGVITISLRRTPVAMETKSWVFEHKISYSPAGIDDMCQIHVQNGGFEVVQFHSIIEIGPRPTLVVTVTKS